jgi:hypothetical protein
MPTALDPNTPWEYQLLEDRDYANDEDRKKRKNGTVNPGNTIFELGFLTHKADADITNALVEASRDSDAISYRSGTQTMKILTHGVRGWRNFNDKDGNAVEWKSAGGRPPKMQEACIDYLTPKQRTELANAIVRGSDVEEEEQD